MAGPRLIRAAIAAGVICAVGWLPVERSTAIRAQAAASAQSTTGVDASLFAGLHWRSLGPARGGRSQAVAGSTSRPLEYYFGATGGGLWKTTDGGQTWRAVTDRFFKSSSVGAVAVAESNPDVVYVGTGETELRGDILQGDGVYKSTDGGSTWSHVGLEKTLAIARIRIHPTNPAIVYVAALGDPYGPNPDRGIFKTTDGGKNWKRVLFRDEKTGAVDLGMDPKNPEVLYAGLWEVFRTSYSLSSGGPGSGLLKTTDGGETWTEITKNPGLPKLVWGKVGVAISGADPSRVYAIVEAAEGGVFLSDDGGGTWKLINDDRRLRQRAFYYTRIYADPQVKDTIYILNTGIYRSTDAGKSIRAIRVPHGDNHDLWIASNDSKRMINSNDGGAKCRRTPAKPGRIRTIRPRSSTTSSRRRTCRITSAERSRTAAQPVCRARVRSLSTRSAAARAVTSRPIRGTRTCSTPAATADCSPGPTSEPASGGRSTSGRTTRWASRPETSPSASNGRIRS